MRKGALNYSSSGLQTARILRKEASIGEKILWERLRNRKLGVKFRRQHPVGPYVLDFYCSEAKLCVEVDGEQHEEGKERDLDRDEYLRQQLVDTIRIPSLDLFEETGLALGRWLRLIESRCCERRQPNL